MTAINKRIDKLEAAVNPDIFRAFVEYPEDPGYVTHEGERIPIGELDRRYPGRTLIRVIPASEIE